MPQEITWNDFSAGWVPSDNDINGRKNGFLQMDNVSLDENGAIVLNNGINFYYNITGDPGDPTAMYSRYLPSGRMDYVSTNSGSVYRNGSFLSSGGSTVITAFGTAFDYVLICSASVRLKDTGTTQYNLGVSRPASPPTVAISAAYTPNTLIGPVTSQFKIVHGTYVVVGSYIQLIADFNGDSCMQSWNIPSAPFDCNNLTGVGGSANVGYAVDTDFIVLSGYTPEPNGKSLQFDVLLAAGNVAGDTVSDYYTYVVEDLAKEATFNTDGSFSIKMLRKDFERNGAGQQSWSTVYGFRLTFKGDPNQVINVWGNQFGDPNIKISGGDKSQFGTYQYVQVNVNNTGSYVGKSPLGVISINYEIDRSQALITPVAPNAIDPQANEAWIFRKGGTLGTWYRVLVFNASDLTPKYDMMSDTAALQLNIKYNQNLTSISAAYIGDHILSIVGPIEGRWFYFTNNMMYPSEINDPDLVDPTIAVKLTGSNAEKFLWAFKLNERTVIIGTSVDIYLLTGTFITQPDFTVDMYYDSLGSEYPPVTYNACENANGVFYMAKDGWRVVAPNGESKNIVAPNTDRLYDNKTCYGYVPVPLNARPGDVKYPVVISKNKLWCFVVGRIEVFDFNRNYWKVIAFPGSYNSVGAACTTQDGRILAAFNIAGGVREIDYNLNKLLDGGNQIINIKSLVLDNNTPDQRKDSMVLKITAYTGGSNVNVNVINDAGVSSLVGTINSFNPQGTEFNLDISATSAAITKTYQIQITGTVADFRLTEVKFVFETRPIPVNFARITSLNYGTVARKRLYSIPFQIDTRSNNVIFTPVVDGTTHPTFTINSNFKQTFNYKSLLSGIETDILGKDFEYTFHVVTGGVFELFEMPQPRLVEVLPDPIMSYVDPNNNFGNTARKRLRLRRIIIDTRGNTVVYTPIIDGVAQTAANIVTNRKQTYFHYFTSDQIGVDWGGTLSCSSGVFELYGILEPQQDDIEIFPDSTMYYKVPVNNYGTTGRKRIRTLRFVLDTKGQNVTFQPIIDGVNNGPSVVFNSNGKKTFHYWYNQDAIGIDFSGIFTGTTEFEVWAVLPPEEIDVEAIPDALEYMIIPPNNYGTDNQKHLRSFALVLNTRGYNVKFTPIVDGVQLAPTSIFNTIRKDTVTHYFPDDVIGVDFGGILESIETPPQPFELYNILQPGDGDITPITASALFYDIEKTNFGSPNKKRVRVLPFVINTHGHNVTFTPIVDCQFVGPVSVFNTSCKKTVWHFFDSDVFGVDYGGNLSGSSIFDLHQIMTPDIVQVLPIARRFDQVGPSELFKYGKIKQVELRVLPFNSGAQSNITCTIYFNDNTVYSNDFVVENNKEASYFLGVPKGTAGNIVRIELGPTTFDFHRFYMRLQCMRSGIDTEAQWISLETGTHQTN